MRKILLIIPMLMLVVACSTHRQIVEIPVPVETVKTEYIHDTRIDSVFVKDSVDRYISGDTVYQTKYKYIYKYTNRTDTVHKMDSIQVPVEIKTVQIQEIQKPLKWWQTSFMYLGIAFFIILVFIAYKKFKK